MVLNKSADLISNTGDQYKRFRKQASEIKELKVNWNKRMEELQKEGFSQKDITNTKIEKQKLEDLEFLQKQTVISPFPKSEDIHNYLEISPDNKKIIVCTLRCISRGTLAKFIRQLLQFLV